MKLISLMNVILLGALGLLIHEFGWKPEMILAVITIIAANLFPKGGNLATAFGVVAFLFLVTRAEPNLAAKWLSWQIFIAIYVGCAVGHHMDHYSPFSKLGQAQKKKR